MSRLIAIVGPTAVGKSRLAIHLAQSFNGEIVSADSRQVYRYMDIGTAKTSTEERALIPHHLIDVVDPDQDFSLALYQEMAYRAIDDIQQRGRLALLVGGSGLYVHAMIGGLRVPRVAPDAELRRSLEEKAAAGFKAQRHPFLSASEEQATFLHFSDRAHHCQGGFVSQDRFKGGWHDGAGLCSGSRRTS